MLLALTIAAPALAQDAPRDTLLVLPDDHPSRPQPPPGVGPGAGSAIAKTLFWPFLMADEALLGTTIVIEEEAGGFAAGLSDRPEVPGEEKHLRPRFGSIGTRSGVVGVGFTYEVFPPDLGPKLGFSGHITNRYVQEYTAFAGWNDPDVAPWLRVTGYYDVDHMDQFWGLGPDTDLDDDESGFSWERWGGVAAVGIPEGWVVNGEIHALYERSFVYETYETNQRNATDVFVAVPGVDLPQAELWSPGGTIRLDLRNSPGHPTRGLLVEGFGGIWRSLDDELPFDWTEYGGEIQAHLPLGSDWHVISLGGELDVVEPDDDDSVIPFVYLPTIGGSSRGRGFKSWRWRDEAVASAVAEYRYRIWEEHTWRSAPGVLEAALFVEAGDLADEIGDLDTEDLKWSYGFEIRMFLRQRPVFSAGIGFSDETTSLNVSTGGFW